jgi:hypothetical protein
MTSEQPFSADPLPWLTPTRLFLGLGGLSLIIIIVGTCGLYSTSGPLPPPRPAPPPPAASTVTAYRYKEGYYRSLVEEDARKLGVKKELTRELWRANGYFSEFTGSQRLKVGGVLETTHLQLQLVSQKVWVGEEGDGYRTEHLVLQISNRTDRYLAYRVQTEVDGKCGAKGVLLHNALALRPEEQLERSECLENGAGPLVVKRVEVLEISALGYYYVSRIDPTGLGAERRTAEGHQLPGHQGPCKLLPWRMIAAAIQHGDLRWYDVIDFYARHNCDEYTFFIGYQWTAKPPKRLPAIPPGA